MLRSRMRPLWSIQRCVSARRDASSARSTSTSSAQPESQEQYLDCTASVGCIMCCQDTFKRLSSFKHQPTIDRQQAVAEQERQEPAQVARPDAVVHPAAVVVKLCHAPAAQLAHSMHASCGRPLCLSRHAVHPMQLPSQLTGRRRCSAWRARGAAGRRCCTACACL